MSTSLRERRLELNMTLEEVATSVGVGRSTVRKWETGFIQNMGRDKILALAKTLKLSPMDIIDPDHEIPDSLVDDIADTARNLSPIRQKKVYAFATDQLKKQRTESTSVQDNVKQLPHAETTKTSEMDPFMPIAAHLDHEPSDEERAEVDAWERKIAAEDDDDENDDN